MRTAFVTGAQGLLGSWLVRALLERDVRVVVLTRGVHPGSALRLEGLMARCVEVRGELQDGTLLAATIAAHDVDTVFHLAAQALAQVATSSPVPTLETNVRGTWQLLEAARNHGVRGVVIASTDRVYRSDGAARCTEDAPLDPPGPYEASKAAADLIAAAYAHTYGLPLAVARSSNLYGGGDLHASRLVTATTAALLRGRPPVIWSDGTPERDYLHAQDAASGYLALADALEAGRTGPGEAFNVGGGVGRSVRQVVDALIDVTGADTFPDVRGVRAAGAPVDRHVADPGRLQALTGWAPQLGFEDGLRRTVAWFREHPQTVTP